MNPAKSLQRAFVAFAMLLPALALLTVQAGPRDSLRIAFIAYEDPNRLSDDVQPVVEYLEQRLGRKVEHFAAIDRVVEPHLVGVRAARRAAAVLDELIEALRLHPFRLPPGSAR